MKDDEVGKLWRQIIQSCGRLDDCDNHGDIVGLIRKLVEERAWKIAANYYRGLPDTAEEQTCIKAALRDFGIDPKEWDQ